MKKKNNNFLLNFLFLSFLSSFFFSKSNKHPFFRITYTIGNFTSFITNLHSILRDDGEERTRTELHLYLVKHFNQTLENFMMFQLEYRVKINYIFTAYKSKVFIAIKVKQKRKIIIINLNHL